MNRPPLLQLQGLRVRYGNVPALQGLDLTVDEGELVTLLGSNGAGKSSTLRAISALVPTEGRILWRGGNLAACLPIASCAWASATAPRGAG
jgi:branched-chain amino acid transport system ATP-binding protein